jgi:hypothetical protein
MNYMSTKKLFINLCSQKKSKNCPQQAPMADGYNLSYSGGKDREDCSSKTVWANILQDSILKISSKKTS